MSGTNILPGPNNFLCAFKSNANTYQTYFQMTDVDDMSYQF